MDDISLLDSLADGFVDSLEGGSSDQMLQMLLDNFGSPDTTSRPGPHAAGHPPPFHGAVAPTAPLAPPANGSLISARGAHGHSGTHPHQPAAIPPHNLPSVPSAGNAFVPTPSVACPAPPPSSSFTGPSSSQHALLGGGGGGGAAFQRQPAADAALLRPEPSCWSPGSRASLGGLDTRPHRSWPGYSPVPDSPQLLLHTSDSATLLGRGEPAKTLSARRPDSSSGNGPTGGAPYSGGAAETMVPVGLPPTHAAKPSGPPPAVIPTAAATVAQPSARPPPRSTRRRSLLLRVFNGLMRPEVALLAAAAAQRACVTEPSVRPGLYFTVAQPAPQAAGAGPQPASSSLSGGGGGGGAAGVRGMKPAKKVVKERLVADPFRRLYPEADQELMGTLYGMRPLPRRVRVQPIEDRCHPCFRNPYEALAGVAERRKLVACGSVPDGGLLGPYTGEIRSGRLDERLVGSDMSGVEGLKAAFTLTLLDDLEPPQPPAQTSLHSHSSGSSSTASSALRKPASSGAHPGAGGTGGAAASGTSPAAQPPSSGPDCLVVVGDPATCPLAEANAPRFWGPCSSLSPGAIGMGNRAACNCRAYMGREANAAVVPCVLKIQLSRLRAAVDSEAEDGADEKDVAELRKGLEALRAAAAAVAPPGAPSAGADDASTYVYGIVTAVVTSRALQDGAEVLLRWDSDDSFFAVAEQNLQQHLYIHKLTSERDAAEARCTEARREATLLRKAHQEARTAREAAAQRLQEVECQRDEALRQRDELGQQRDEVLRQRDEALRDLQRHRAAAAAEAAAARLEEEAGRVEAETAAAAASAAATAAAARASELERRAMLAERERDALKAELLELRGQQVAQCPSGCAPLHNHHQSQGGLPDLGLRQQPHRSSGGGPQDDRGVWPGQQPQPHHPLPHHHPHHIGAPHHPQQLLPPQPQEDLRRRSDQGGGGAAGPHARDGPTAGGPGHDGDSSSADLYAPLRTSDALGRELSKTSPAAQGGPDHGGEGIGAEAAPLPPLKRRRVDSSVGGPVAGWGFASGGDGGSVAADGWQAADGEVWRAALGEDGGCGGGPLRLLRRYAEAKRVQDEVVSELVAALERQQHDNHRRDKSGAQQPPQLDELGAVQQERWQELPPQLPHQHGSGHELHLQLLQQQQQQQQQREREEQWQQQHHHHHHQQQEVKRDPATYDADADILLNRAFPGAAAAQRPGGTELGAGGPGDQSWKPERWPHPPVANNGASEG